MLGYFSIKQLCGTTSVLLMVTVNVFSIRATLVSYLYKMLVHYIKFSITQVLIYVKYRSLSVKNCEWVIM